MQRYTIYIFSLASYILFNWGSVAFAKDEIDANIQPLFDACMNRCDRTDILGNLTREGCLKGCDQIRRTFPLTEKTYSSSDSCLKDIKEIDLNRDILIEEYQAWCVKNYDHIHKRKGCKDAIEVYINTMSYENVCTRKEIPPVQTTSSSSLPLPVPMQKSAVSEKTEGNTTIGVTVTPKSTIKTSDKTVHSAITEKSQTKSNVVKTAKPSLHQVSDNKTSLGPSIKPLSLDKKIAPSPVTPQKRVKTSPSSSLRSTEKKKIVSTTTSLNTSQNSSLTTKEKREKNTLTTNNKVSLPSTPSINAKKEMKEPKNVTIPTARTVSTRDAMPLASTAKKAENNLDQQKKAASQKIHKENKESLSQELLKNNKEKSIERETTNSTSNTNNKAKKVITSDLEQQQINKQVQEIPTAKLDTASILVTPLEEPKEGLTSVSINKNMIPIQKATSKEIELPTDKKSIAQNATVVAKSISMESSNSTAPIVNLATPKHTTNATEPITTKLSPELEQLVNDVHTEIDSTEATPSPLNKENIDTATLLSTTISSPVPSLGGISKGFSDESVPQPQTNSTTIVENQMINSAQSSQNTIDPSTQLTQRLRKNPETAPQPYGLALPASAVKAPPPPIP